MEEPMTEEVKSDKPKQSETSEDRMREIAREEVRELLLEIKGKTAFSLGLQ
jgi:hypothetical protein